MRLLLLFTLTRDRLRDTLRERDEAGMTTAELLGNAALGIAALVAIWGALRVLGVDIVDWIGQQIGVSG